MPSEITTQRQPVALIDLQQKIAKLKVEYAENSAEITELNAEIKNSATTKNVRDLCSRRAELAANHADIAAELVELKAAIIIAEQESRSRSERAAALRMITCALIIEGDYSSSKPSGLVAQAQLVEAAIQHASEPKTKWV